MATTQLGSVEKAEVRRDKAEAVERYTEVLKTSKSVFLADYLGLDVEQMRELRTSCREESIGLRVVKNRLMKLAATAAGYPALVDHLAGPIAIATSETDEVAPAKLLTRFAKVHGLPRLKGAVVDGSVYDAAEAEGIAKLPGLNELRSQILQLLNAPATQLVRVIDAPGTDLVRVLDARREQLEQQRMRPA